MLQTMGRHKSSSRREADELWDMSDVVGEIGGTFTFISFLLHQF